MEAFASLLGSVAEAVSMWRRDETTRLAAWRNKHLIAATCPCGRSIRATASWVRPWWRSASTWPPPVNVAADC